MFKSFFLFNYLFLSLFIRGYSKQVNEVPYPMIGEPCPEFVLHNIHCYKRQQANLKDFRGKWLVLDFWNKYCGACVASFPHINDLQKEFDGKVQFILVGIQDKEAQIEPMYEQFRKHEKLIVAAAFDSLLAQQFDIFTAPYIIVIDPYGIVRAITVHVSKQNLNDLLEGKFVMIEKAYRVHEDEAPDLRITFDKQRPFLVSNNGGIDSVFLFRSLLSVYDGAKLRPYFPRTIGEDTVHGRFQAIGVPMEWLYRYAYFGSYHLDTGSSYSIELDIKDSSIFKYSLKRSEQIFNYSLQVPSSRANLVEMKGIMRRDLENFTGFKACTEDRLYPCWRLVASEEARERLKTKGGKSFVKELISRADYDFQNYPFSDFVKILRLYSDFPILDETGIKYNIDLRFQCFLMDFNQVQHVLKEIGLELIPSKHYLKTIIIRDN